MTGPDATVARAFAAQFGGEPAVVASAHGRVNLIGEHTDYNGGFVLPTAIPQATHVALAPRGDDRACVFSRTLPDEGVVVYSLGHEHRYGEWIDYVQGITFVLRRAGFTVGGFDAWIDSDVPLGSGVSSSAALEVRKLGTDINYLFKAFRNIFFRNARSA